MKTKVFILTAFAVISVLPVCAAEIDVQAEIGNTLINADKGKMGTISGGASISVKEQLTDNIALRFGYAYDPMMLNSLSGAIEYTGQYLVLSAGPYFGLFNEMIQESKNPLIVQPGMSLKVGFSAPGAVLAEISSDVAWNPVITGKMSVLDTRIKAGVYFPNVIFSFIAEQRYQTLTVAGGNLLRMQNNYYIEADAFKEGVPWRGTLTAGFRLLENRYDSAPGKNTKVGAVTAGFQLLYDTMNKLSYYGAVSTPFYVFALEGNSVLPNMLFFDLSFGIRIK